MVDIMFLKSILLRKGLRSDTIWANPLLLREPFRRIPFYLDMYALSKSQYWPREKLKQLGFERFAEIVKHAATIPFWKERFAAAGIDPDNFHESDIARIPVLSKKDFQDRDIAEYTVPELLLKSRRYSTSGSTGRPLMFYHDPAFELRSPAAFGRMFRTAGDGEHFPVIGVRKTAHFYVGDYMKYHLFYVKGYNDVRHRIRELEKLISAFPGKVILVGLGSTMLELARVCREFNMSFPLYCVFVSGEELRSSQRKEIEEELHADVRTWYGVGEMLRPGAECSHHRLHVSEEMVYFEIIDSHGTPLPPGTKGRLIVTGFENQVMPFIRYDTGDIGVLNNDPCPCGRTLRTLEFQGRKMKLLHVGDGRTVSLLDFSAIFDTYPRAIHQFQIVRTGECAFTMRIVPGTKFDKKRTKLFAKQFKLRIHPNVAIEWETVDFIPEGPNGKALYFIDKFETEI
ncbi:MAG: hypothetical protein WC814_02310 [Candidatus Paceibacterota bacterium]|jgi:phenylacetate-CoA ligase